MSIGIAGDAQAELGASNPQPATTMAVIELRVISRLLLAIAGPAVEDELDALRADEAFALTVQTPLPGNNR